MNDRYIVPFITLLGAAFTSIILAIRVFLGQTDIVRALLYLLIVVIIFFIIGNIVRKIMNKIRAKIKEQELEYRKALEAEALASMENEDNEAGETQEDDTGE